MTATLCIRAARRVFNFNGSEMYSDEDFADAFMRAYNADPNLWKWNVSVHDADLPVMVRGLHGDVDLSRSTDLSNKMLLALNSVVAVA